VKERYSAKKGQRCLLINNPNIPSDRGFHVGVFPEESRVHDFRPEMSEYNGDFVHFVATIRGFRWIDAYQEITGEQASTIEAMGQRMRLRMDAEAQIRPEPKPVEMAIMPKGFLPITAEPDRLCKMALAYLAKRQVSHEEAIKLRIHYGVNAICFPFYEYDEMVYWQVRDLLSKRFRFPEGLAGQEYLWNIDNTQIMGDMFITESNFNAAVIGEGGTAAGTANMSRTQILKIKTRQPSRIILCADHDAAGVSSILHNFFAMESEAVFKHANHDRILYAVPEKIGADWNDYAVENDRIKNQDVVRAEILRIAKPITIAERLRLKQWATQLKQAAELS
jgi:hypothetical protein